MYVLLQAASSDLFSMGNNLATKFGKLGAAILALVIGILALRHITNHSHGAAIVVVLIAIIPAWFLLDPTGAVNTLKSTVSGL